MYVDIISMSQIHRRTDLYKRIKCVHATQQVINRSMHVNLRRKISCSEPIFNLQENENNWEMFCVLCKLHDICTYNIG